MIRAIHMGILLGLSVLTYSQEASYLELVKAESELSTLFGQLYADTLSEKQRILDKILRKMPDVLELDGAMEYPWNGLERIGVVTSGDGRVRLFTWHVEEDPDTFRYFGLVQVELRRGRVRVTEMVDNGKNQRDLYTLDQSAGNWYGKLYYGIVTTEYRRQTIYTLLGMDFKDRRSTLKTVEAMEIQRNRPHFLKERFFNGSDLVDRLVLEYSSQVAISVRWDPGLEMITFDHLVPFHQVYSGNYEFYGPDGSFDGLEFTDGIWVYRRDIDARNRN